MSAQSISDNTRDLYDEIRFGHAYRIGKRVRYYPLLEEVLKSAGQGRALIDAGCGAGFWIEEYLKNGVKKEKIIAIDISPKSLEPVRDKGVKTICSDLKDIDLEDNAAEIVICNGVLHHIDDHKKAFSELVRITRPGGLIYLNVYNVWHPYYYIIHKAAFFLRYIYWHQNKNIADFVFPLFKLFFLPAARMVLGLWPDDNTARTVFLDQVFVPEAKLFSKSQISALAKENKCLIQNIRTIKYGLLIEAIIKK